MANLCGKALEKIARDAKIEKNYFQLGKHNHPLLPIFFLGAAWAPLCYCKAAQDKKLWQNNMTVEK